MVLKCYFGMMCGVMWGNTFEESFSRVVYYCMW